MSEADPSEFLADPLGEITRKERRNLLIASSVGAIMVHAGLVPSDISALGIKFSPPAQGSILLLAAAVIGYFVFAFVIYALADFMIWRKRRHDYIVDVEFETGELTAEEVLEQQGIKVPDISWYYRWSSPVAYARVFFEFVVPVLVGLYAIGALLFRAWHP